MDNNTPDNKDNTQQQNAVPPTQPAQPAGQQQNTAEGFGTAPQPPKPPQAAPASQPAQPAAKPQAAPASQPAQPTAKPTAKTAPAAATGPKLKPGQRILTKDEIMQREAARNKKILLGCGGFFGCGTILLIILVFFFVGTAGSGSSSLAQALGINQASLVNSLVTIVNVFFGLGALLAFVLSIVGVFKALMARKDDKITKRKGWILAASSFGALVLIIVLWISAWFYLDSQKVPEVRQSSDIETIPEVVTGLTAPVDITFDVSNLSYERNTYDILSYEWDFGDGTKEPGSAVETHTYTSKGTGRYDVKLSITFKHKTTGEENTVVLEETVTIAEAQVAAVINADVKSGPAPLTVTFDGSESTDPDGEIETYEWDPDGKGYDFGEETFEHTYEQVGTYTAKLRVINSEGESSIAEQTIEVTEGNMPEAVIDVLNFDGDKFFTGQNYTFDASKSSSPEGSIKEYEWDFGDGTPKSRTRTAQHTFTEVGDYRVVLSVIDEEDNKAETTLEAEVEIAAAAPMAKLVTVPAKANIEDNFIQGTVPFEVNFDGSQSTDPDDDIIDYKWDFDNDGEYEAFEANTTYTFEEPDTYTVTLIVVDSAGYEAKDIILVNAQSRGLEATVVADPPSGVVPLTVNFDATGSSYSDGDIVSYEWDFGDGSTPRSDIGTVTYKYTKIGNFTAKVKVRTNDNKEETADILISVRQVPLKSCFEPTTTVGDAPLTVTFNPQCSTGTIAKYRWQFGDGETSAERKPTYTFENPGSYEVVLEVSDAQNVINSSTQFITVTGELTRQ